jgi:hypothetical protein
LIVIDTEVAGSQRSGEYSTFMSSVATHARIADLAVMSGRSSGSKP